MAITPGMQNIAIGVNMEPTPIFSDEAFRLFRECSLEELLTSEHKDIRLFTKLLVERFGVESCNEY